MTAETRWVVTGQGNRVRYISLPLHLRSRRRWMGVRRDVTRLQASRPRSCARPPQSWAHSTHPAGTDDQQGGSPKGVRCVFLVPSGPGDSGRGCSEYPNSGLRSGFLFVPSRTRVQNLRRISSPSVSDGTRVLMRKNVQSNHRTYSVMSGPKSGESVETAPRELQLRRAQDWPGFRWA